MEKGPAKNQKRPRGKTSLKKEIIYLCSCCAGLVLLLITGLNLNVFLSPKQVLGTTSDRQIYYESLIQENDFWNKFLDTNPDYFDGWIRLIDLNLEINNQDRAMTAYQKALNIDPNNLKLKPYTEFFRE